LSNTRSLSEIVTKTCELKTKDEKVSWLKENNSEALRTILTVMFDTTNFVWNIPNDSVPPYKPSPHVESHGMLYRQARKLRYFIKGYDGENLTQYRREFLFIEMLESIDPLDAKLMETVLLQEPPEGLTLDVVNEALNLTISNADQKSEPKKRGRKPKNV
jgi:hypothetical protein